MKLVNFARRNPLFLLGVLGGAFIVWVWSASRPLREVAEIPVLDSNNTFVYLPDGSRPPPSDGSLRKPVPPALPDPAEKAKPAPQGTAQSLSKLKPGMTRAAVEELVGVPSAQDTYPATVADGRVIYHTTYEADLEPPATVRPIRIPRPQPMGRDPQPKERTLVTLEFDATKPGHPLLGIYYPDPLF
jgi:hypothetical protein